MHLEKIKIDNCPSCGADAMCDKKIRHDPTSKDFSEERTFTCGLKISNEEGFEESITIKPCGNSYDSSKRVEAICKIFEFINSLDVDDHFKSELKMCMCVLST